MMDNRKWPGVIRSNFFNDGEKLTFEGVSKLVQIRGLLNETILADMRSELAKMSRAGVVGMEDSMADKLQDLLSSSETFSLYLSDHFDKSFDKILAYYKGALEDPKNKLNRMMASGKFDFPKDNLSKEVECLGKLCAFWLKDFKSIFMDSTKKKYAKCLLVESLEVSADVVPLLHAFDPSRLNESKDPWSFLDRAKKAIEGTEPFDTVREVGNLSGEIGNSTLNKFADLSKRLGGPECVKMYGLGSVARKLTNLREEQLSADDIIKKDPMLRFLPTGKSIIECLEIIACAVCVLELFTEKK
jgi:hypothetical protein